jgi:two-component system chemotaxis response regulator CheY
MTIKKPLRVLIVDDNEMTRGVLRTIVNSDEAYSVIGEASNGTSGLEMALQLRPDMICLDVVMPDYNGLAILEEVKKKLSATVVLMVTVNNDHATVHAAMKLGADGFIIKPFNVGTVLDSIEHAADRLRKLKAK